LRKVTVHYEIRPENEKWPTARSRGIHSARQAVKRPEAEISPWPARLQTALRVPGCHAARDGNRPTGPLALSASRALGRDLGLDRESLFPPGPKLGPVIVSHPSQSNGCARFPVEQNCVDSPRTNPSLIRFSAPTHALQRAAERLCRPTSDSARAEGACPRRRLEPLAGVRAHHWVNAPLSSGLSGISSRTLAQRWRASAPSRSQRRALIHKRCAGEILGPTTRRLAVVRVLPARLIDPRPTVTCEGMQVSVKPYSISSDPLSSSSTPALDLRASPALVPMWV
jgi:hypothetical protein